MTKPSFRDLNREQFADLLRKFPIEQYDSRIGVAWLKEDAGMHQCVDRVDLQNHQAGGTDNVRVVFAERGVDAVIAIEAYRQARSAPR